MPAQTNLLDGLIVDNFAGGGGASTGMELALGRPVDIAINHDPVALELHKRNHPYTQHYCENVWDIKPGEITRGRSVALAWFSPDCKHFSKAKGGKPVDKKIRGLAWVVIRWAATVKPKVIMLENVAEFMGWGPVDKNGKPIKEQAGRTFDSFINALRGLGYAVEWRVLKACDYGAPTWRERLFIIARCDGKPIAWPKVTHGKPDCPEVKAGLLKPYRTAAEIIDWSIPCPSIFERKKPLRENTLRRIARGIFKFVINNPEPFILDNKFNNTDSSIKEPVKTLLSGNHQYLVMPFLTQYHGEQSGKEVRGQPIEQPIMTLDTQPRYALVQAFLHKYYDGGYTGCGSSLNDPLGTVTAIDHNSLVTASFVSIFRNNAIGQSHNEPLRTIATSPGHFAEVRAFLVKYYGQGYGQGLDEPLHTITAKDRFGLVTVQGQDYAIADIGLRMLQPHELFAAHAFPGDYIISFIRENGKPLPKAEQTAKVGNSVVPLMAERLVRANLPELCNKKFSTMAELNREIAV